MKIKKIIITIILLLTLLLSTKSYAALQANGSAGATNSLPGWLTSIRQMEALGGALGLKETINSSSLLSTSGSNNLDIHMQKNTEYGAIAILSASSYGNPNKVTSGGTTTGNQTGIVMNLNKEWVAAGYLTAVSQFTNANARYKNVYSGSISGNTLSYTAKKGDTISETAGWHGSGASVWLSGTGGSNVTTEAGLLRAYSGSIFSYYGMVFDAYQPRGQEARDAYYAKSWYSRAIMVCGEGI